MVSMYWPSSLENAFVIVLAQPYSTAAVFSIGQIYRSPQSPNAATDLVQTTKGYLSKGNSHPITINGGLGNDEFTVLRNTQVLDLNGDAGDDTLIIKSYRYRVASEVEMLDYVVNSVLDFDGGTGGDSILVESTEAAHSYVFTTIGILGGGLSIRYKAIERIMNVGDPQARDQLTVLSTDPEQVLELFADGNKPDDDSVNPREVNPVVSRNLRGHRGIINHQVSSDDPAYGNDLYVEGIAVDVLDNDGNTAYVNILQVEEFHFITEDGLGSFSFLVYPTREPNGTVAVDIIAPADRDGNRMLQLNYASTAGITLIFDSIQPQQVQVSYQPTTSTPLAITERDLMIKTVLNTAGTTDERFIETKQSILPIDITLIPGSSNAMAKSVTVVKPTESMFVVEGSSDEENAASYDLILRPCPIDTGLAGELRIVAVPAGQVLLNGNNGTAKISHASWARDHNCNYRVQVVAAAGDGPGGAHFVTLRHALEDPGGAWTALSDGTRLRVPDVVIRIYGGGDRPGVVVSETQGSTSTMELHPDDDLQSSEQLRSDSYLVRLASPPADGTFVNVSLRSVPTASDYPAPSTLSLNRNTSARVQVRPDPEVLVFDNETWDSWRTIYLVAVDDGAEEGVDYFHFPALPRFGRGSSARRRDRRRATTTTTTNRRSQGRPQHYYWREENEKTRP